VHRGAGLLPVDFSPQLVEAQSTLLCSNRDGQGTLDTAAMRVVAPG
jgi:hypothetical protein